MLHPRTPDSVTQKQTYNMWFEVWITCFLLTINNGRCAPPTCSGRHGNNHCSTYVDHGSTTCIFLQREADLGRSVITTFFGNWTPLIYLVLFSVEVSFLPLKAVIHDLPLAQTTWIDNITEVSNLCVFKGDEEKQANRIC